MNTSITDYCKDPPNTYLLRDMEGEIVELSLYYVGGVATIFGRVTIIKGTLRTFISVGPSSAGCTLPIDTTVRKLTYPINKLAEAIEFVVNV